MKLTPALSAVIACSSVASATYCSWFGFRGAQINSTVALEGGLLSTGTFTNGGWQNTGLVSAGGGGIYRTLDLTKSFSAGADAEKLLTTIKEPVDVNAPSFFHGAMFHNDRSWWGFSGQPSNINPSALSNSVLRDTLYKPNAGISISDGLSQADGTNGVFKNVSASAYASSGDPGQKLGWLFGGMHLTNNATWKWQLSNTTGLEAVDAFYQADMATSDYTMRLTSNQSPGGQQISGYLPRAQGGLVWLPFGSKGVLLALGGVQYPADLYASKSPVQTVNNTYMSDLLIYDIAGSKWYSQSTLENGAKPSQLAAFCTAVVPSQDNYSQEIIVYGGYDGTNDVTRLPSDDVWILSVPAFEWTQVISSKNQKAHGRKSQFCFAPNPSTFVTIGGSALSGGAVGSDTFIDVLNLNNLSWNSTYDPTSGEGFAVPSAVVSQLKWPDAKGPGSRVVGKVGDQALSSLFSTAYPTAIKNNYPYAVATSSSTPSSTTTPAPPSAPKPGPNIPLIASLATVIPVLIIAAIIAFFCLRRRKQRKNRTRGKDSDVNSWVNKVGRDEKSNGYSETTAVDSPYDDFGRSPVLPAVPRKNTDIYEAENTTARASAVQSPDHLSHKQADRQYFELDNDPRGTTALSSHPANISGQHSDIRSELGSDKHASELPQASSRENLSVPAGGVVAGTSQPSSISRKPVADRRDSTPLPSPATPNMGHTRGTSDVSSAALTASPNTEMRRSQYIDGLPEQPGHLGEGRSTPTTQGRASAYKENI